MKAAGPTSSIPAARSGSPDAARRPAGSDSHTRARSPACRPPPAAGLNAETRTLEPSISSFQLGFEPYFVVAK